MQPAAQPGHAASNPDIGKMFQEYGRRVFATAYRITGNAQDAEDAMQTVFLRLARREGGSPLSDSPLSYLNRAAINAALDVMRARKSDRATSLDNVEPTLASSPDVDPGHQQGASELRDRVRQALTKVSDKAAEIFILRYFEGYGNNEIARMLGTSRSTINVTLHRTRKRLKDEILAFRGETS